MALGGFFKAVGKGARAVGRGAMKGVLGFDDRDISRRFKRGGEEEEFDDSPSERYTGFSRGKMPEVESDGFDVEEMDVEEPPDIGVSDEETLIEMGGMPELPGFKARGRGGKARAGMVSLKGSGQPGGVQIEAERVTPSAYETVTAGQKADAATARPMGLGVPGAGMIMDTEDSFLDRGLRLLGGSEDALLRAESGMRDPSGVNKMQVPGYMALMMPQGGGKGVTGLTNTSQAVRGGLPAVRSGSGGLPATRKIIDVDATRSSRGSMLGGERQGQIGTEGLPGFEMRGGTGPTPYGRAASSLAGRQLPGRTSRPIPGPGGAEGPFPPLPPGVSQFKNGKMRYSGPM
jgi:hypothetical protein